MTSTTTMVLPTPASGGLPNNNNLPRKPPPPPPARKINNNYRPPPPPRPPPPTKRPPPPPPPRSSGAVKGNFGSSTTASRKRPAEISTVSLSPRKHTTQQRRRVSLKAPTVMRDVTVFQKKHQVGEGTYGYVSLFCINLYMLKKKRQILICFMYACFYSQPLVP